MIYIAGIFILLSAMYILSFAIYNLKRNNRRAAAGALILAFSVLVLPLIVMFMG